MSFSPIITVPKDRKKKTVRIRKAWRDQGVIDEAVEALKSRFPVSLPFRVKWATGGVKVSPQGQIELISTAKRGREVWISPILGHGEVPGGVRRAAIYLGMLMAYCDLQQAHILDGQGKKRTPPPNPFDHPALMGWIEDNMKLEPESQFYEMFIERFWRWFDGVGL